jgi:2-oxoglutarate ferredoxin oxidoreductase subunit delta
MASGGWNGGFAAAVAIDEAACRGCGSCVAVCPAGVLELAEAWNAQGYAFARIAADGCRGEAHCLYACPEGAIRLETSHVRLAV